MKWLKYVLYAVLGLIGLVLIAIAVIAVTFDPNQYRDDIEKLVKDRTGRTLKFHGEIRLAFWPSLGAQVGKVTLSRRASAHDFAAIDSARVSVALLPLLRGEVLVDQVSVSGLKASVIRAKGGTFDFEDLLGAGKAKKPAAAAPAAAPTRVKFDVAGVRLENGTFAYQDLGTGQTLEVQGLALRTGRIAEDVPGNLSLAAALKGKNPLVDAKVALDSGYRFSLERGEYALTGLSLKLDGTAADFSRLALAVTGEVRAALEKETVNADLGIKFDETTAKAKLAMTKFAAPHYGFDIEVDKIDLDRYMAAQPKAKPAPAPAASPEPKVDVPVDLSALEDLRADGRLSLGALRLQGLNLAEVKAQVRAANGRAEVAPHTAKLYQGTLEGALSLNAAGNRIALKETLANIAIGPLVKDLMGRDAVEGRGNVVIDVNAGGPTVNALKRALGGTARVALRDGAVKGIDLTEVLRKTRAAFGSKSAQQQRADQSQRTDFSEMTASFVIKNGVAHNEDLNVMAPLFRIGGAGDIDIGNSQLNYVARASIVATTKGQGGEGLEHLAGLTVPVKLTGPFDAPKYEIDYRGLASSAAKARVEKEKAKVKEKAKESIEKRLKGLIRR